MKTYFVAMRIVVPDACRQLATASAVESEARTWLASVGAAIGVIDVEVSPDLEILRDPDVTVFDGPRKERP